MQAVERRIKDAGIIKVNGPSGAWIDRNSKSNKMTLAVQFLFTLARADIAVKKAVQAWFVLTEQQKQPEILTAEHISFL